VGGGGGWGGKHSSGWFVDWCGVTGRGALCDLTMALSRRSSRSITVDGVEYRWAVSPDSGYLWLIVERADAPGQRGLKAMRVDGEAVRPVG